MVRTAISAAAIALLSTATHAQPAPLTERQLVERTIQMYFDAWAVGDTALFNRAMHPSLHLKRSLDGKFVDMTREAYVGGTRPHARDSTLATRIASIYIVGPIASARTEISIRNLTFVDFFNLLKVDGGWVIVDKIATSVPRGTAPAVPPHPVKEVVLEGLKRPWGMAFLSATDALISEKEGDLLRVNLTTRARTRIAGFPTDMADSVGAFGRGDNTGKFDVVIDPAFASNRFVYLSYAAMSGRGRTTKVARARLANDSLHDLRTILVAEPYTTERHHFGGGLAFGVDGKLYVTVGERLFNERDEPAWPIAQDRTDRRGKIYRVNPDGSIPSDNPDFGPGAVRGLYALGIRAAQGLTVHPVTGTIWFSEHGTNQGDEINILKAGANYGWPLRTTGTYRHSTYAPPTPRDSLTPPVWSWAHTVAPTALHFYTGDEFPAWKHDLLVGGLGPGSVWRLRIDGETVVSAEELFVNARDRVREVVQSPSGELYLLTDDTNGKLIRVRNAAG
ncbi:MAG: PQQ-dependent sugar dehydrogenase [Gemmatimonadaceae bacterium]|jgi:glucose/arabinose dehydrogenase|nr:PQQ-dependent sugar dehydrogenase [Gemmatimonadaceae bacterium]